MARLTSLLIVALAAAGCAAAAPGTSPSTDPLVATIERDGVRVSLALEGPPLTGARSWVSARVENLGDRAVHWAGGGCDHPVSIEIDLRPSFEPGREWPGLLGRYKTTALGGGFGNPAAGYYLEQSMIRGPNEIPMACTSDLRINELPPGGVLDMRAAWEGTLAEAAPAPAGPAIVSATFPFIGIAGDVPPNQTDAIAITATIETRVVGDGAAAPLSPALAIDAALADPQFSAFVEAAPEPMWINPHLLYEDGLWGIGLFVMTQGGQGERFGEVKVDRTGQVVGHRFER